MGSLPAYHVALFSYERFSNRQDVVMPSETQSLDVLTPRSKLMIPSVALPPFQGCYSLQEIWLEYGDRLGKYYRFVRGFTGIGFDYVTLAKRIGVPSNPYFQSSSRSK